MKNQDRYGKMDATIGFTIVFSPHQIYHSRILHASCLYLFLHCSLWKFSTENVHSLQQLEHRRKRLYLADLPSAVHLFNMWNWRSSSIQMQNIWWIRRSHY